MIRTDSSQAPKLNDVLIQVLVCPKDHSDLIQQGSDLICERCGQRYPIEDGVPNMLIDHE